MEYIFTNLPQYIKTHDRSVFESSVVKENHVLLFSEDGETLTAKLPDGSFQAIGGGTGAFYQCASVDTAAGTWTGYKWRLDSEEGIYELEEELTTDELTVTGFEPVVGYSYSADTLIMAGKLYAGADPMPSDGLVFHASLSSNTPLAETGQELTEQSKSGATNIVYQTYKGVPCAYFSGENSISFSDDTLPTGTPAISISFWIYSTGTNKGGIFNYGYRNGFFVNMNMEEGKIGVGAYGDDNRSPFGLPEGWHHVCCVQKNAGVMNVWSYLDGVMVVEQGYSGWGSINVSSSDGRIGLTVYDNNNYYFTGYLAGIRVYNRALTMDEVKILNNEFRAPYIDIDDTLSLTFKLNEEISYAIGATDSLGNACSYEIVSGTLPTGVEFDGSTGAFSGTPTVEETINVVIKCSTKKAEKEVTVTITVKDYIEFYLNKSLTDSSPNAIPVTNNGLTVSETGIMCTENGYAEIAANALPDSVMCDGKDWTFEIKFRCTDITQIPEISCCLFGYGGGDGRFDVIVGSNVIAIGSYGMDMDYTFDNTAWHLLKFTHDTNNNNIVYFDDMSKSQSLSGKNIRANTLCIGWDGVSANGVRHGYPFEIEYIKIISAIV